MVHGDPGLAGGGVPADVGQQLGGRGGQRGGHLRRQLLSAAVARQQGARHADRAGPAEPHPQPTQPGGDGDGVKPGVEAARAVAGWSVEQPPDGDDGVLGLGSRERRVAAAAAPGDAGEGVEHRVVQDAFTLPLRAGAGHGDHLRPLMVRRRLQLVVGPARGRPQPPHPEPDEQGQEGDEQDGDGDPAVRPAGVRRRAGRHGRRPARIGGHSRGKPTGQAHPTRQGRTQGDQHAGEHPPAGHRARDQGGMGAAEVDPGPRATDGHRRHGGAGDERPGRAHADVGEDEAGAEPAAKAQRRVAKPPHEHQQHRGEPHRVPAVPGPPQRQVQRRGDDAQHPQHGEGAHEDGGERIRCAERCADEHGHQSVLSDQGTSDDRPQWLAEIDRVRCGRS